MGRPFSFACGAELPGVRQPAVEAMADKLDAPSHHRLQSGQLEPVAQKQPVAEGAGLGGQEPKPQPPGLQQGALQQQAAEPPALMVGAHIEQAEMAIAAQGDKAEGGALLCPFNDPAVMLAQLADKTGVMGASGPLLDLLCAVVLGAEAAHRLLEQRDKVGNMVLAEGDDMRGKGGWHI